MTENGDFSRLAFTSYLSDGRWQDLKISFAARIGGDSPVGHYRSKVLLSLAMEPVATVDLFSVELLWRS